MGKKAMEIACTKSWIVEMKIQRVSVMFKIETGADEPVMRERLCRKLNLTVMETTRKEFDAGKQVVKVLATAMETMTYGDKQTNSLPLKDAVKKELTKMVEEEVMAPVDTPTEQYAPMDYTELNQNKLHERLQLLSVDKSLIIRGCKKPEHYKRQMQDILEGAPGEVNQADDILIFGSTVEQHNKRVKEVMRRLQKAGVSLNKEKFKFGVTIVNVLCHKISEDEAHQIVGKVEQ
ncbi:hypothetical protein PR048_009718 [Dryococelus australis]|uniref:Reverse transcriptase domain-containing protein n=1 Tax=Dryococelus australis TaxID=614101 RepID=A0ABQ9I0N1_9NEOP|nr:hypothetical protein PR048_009718 [Dryococelus australis]